MNKQLTKANVGKFIIDDDVQMHEVMEQFLDGNGLTAKITADPTEFMKVLDQSAINIVVIDHFLEHEKTGLDLIKEIKQRNKWSLVIVMTMQSKMDIVVRYLNAGASKYINKNWSKSELMEILGDFPLRTPGKPSYLDVLVKYIQEGIEEAKERIKIVDLLEKYA